MSVYEDGHRIRGGDSTGKCINETSNELSDMGDPTLRFKVDLSYGCSVSYNFADFKKNCDSLNSPVEGLEIFKSRTELTSYGQFGNANIYYPKVSSHPIYRRESNTPLFCQDW